MKATTHEYSLPKELENQASFADSGASHHSTIQSSFLHNKKSYAGQSCICVANVQSLSIKCVGSSCVFSKSCFAICLTLNDILYIPCITRNLLSISKLSRDNQVVFKFIIGKFYIESHVSKCTLLEGFLDSSELYCFPLFLVVLQGNLS